MFPKTTSSKVSVSVDLINITHSHCSNSARLGLTCLMLICLLTGNGSEIFITLVSCLYPGYMSVKAVLSKDTEDDQRWLKYWVLVAALLVFQVVADWLLCWLPGYCLAKAGLLIWCQAPRQDNGSVVLFNSVKPPNTLSLSLLLSLHLLPLS